MIETTRVSGLGWVMFWLWMIFIQLFLIADALSSQLDRIAYALERAHPKIEAPK